MEIFLISTDTWVWDGYDAHTIIANNKKEVVKLAKDESAEEGRTIWNKGNIVKVGVYTGDKKEPFILLSSFNAG